MHPLFPVLMLMVLVGCASPRERQIFWDTERAAFKLEQQRLHDLYRAGFKQGFQDAWGGLHGIGCRFESSDDPEGDAMSDRGYMDGQTVAYKIQLAAEIERLNQEEANLKGCVAAERSGASKHAIG